MQFPIFQTTDELLTVILVMVAFSLWVQRFKAFAEANGVTCMVGCMLETKLAITAGLSLVAAKKNVTEADCDSFLYYKENPVEGGFIQDKDTFTLLDEPGFGITFHM